MPKSSKKIIAIATKAPKRRRRNRRSQARGSLAGSWGLQPTVDYFKSLVDPFECSPPKLGWGCMVPTTVSQMYTRSSFVTNADGSGGIMVMPCSNGGILVNNAGLAVATWVASSFSNAAAIQASFGEGRVASVGVRCTPNIALTAIPGMIYSGALTATTAANINTLTIGDLQQQVTSHQSVSTNGATATGRPVDPDSFTFQIAVTGASGWGSATFLQNTLPFSIPYIAFVGLPASSTVYFEVCINFEGTPVVGHLASTVIPAADDASEAKLSDNWQSPEKMYNRMKPYLPHPGRASDAVASKDSGFLQTILSGLGGIAGTVLGGPFGTALGTAAGGALGSVAQSLLNPNVRSRPGVTQDYSRGMRGYKL